MDDFKVEVCKIGKIEKHPNADRLDIATVKGWQCVVGKDQFKVGDLVVYFPIDSVLPRDLELILFPEDAKVKLSKARVRTIRLRGAISQGLAIGAEMFAGFNKFKVGQDLTETLGVTKYEPAPPPFSVRNGHQRAKKDINPNFEEYTKINHLKNFPAAIQPDDYVVVTEKIHGTNFRAGYVPVAPATWLGRMWNKFVVCITGKPVYEFVFGSRRVQLQNKKLYKGYYSDNVYAHIVNRYKLQEILPAGVVIYGEIYGKGIQKGYDYGCTDDVDLVVFDVMQDGKYLDAFDALRNCIGWGLPVVPTIATDKAVKLSLDHLVGGPSCLHQGQKVREGIVIRSENESQTVYGRKVFKYINPEFLLKEQSEWH